MYTKLKTGTICTAILLLFGAALPLAALDESVTIGPADDWRNIGIMERILLFEGAEGYTEIQLKDAEYEPDEFTDFLHHFNYNGENESTGRYQGSSPETVNHLARFGFGAAVFRGDGIDFLPNAESLFADNRYLQDFSVEFWLYPATMDNEETIFDWEGARQSSEMPLFQQFACTIRNRKLVWTFRNIFLPPDNAPFSLELEGDRRMIPRQWHHHLLRYDASTGLLEYLIDNIPEAIAYTNGINRESAQVYPPYLGESSEGILSIGKGFTGLLDEFRISEKFVENPGIAKYTMDPGYFSTRIIDLGHTNSQVRSVDVDGETPGDTALRFWIRTADQIRREGELDTEWIRFRAGEPMKAGIAGRYLQLRIDLLPDGTGANTPSIRNLLINYSPDLPPLPPGHVTAVPGDGSVTVSWRQEADYDIRGYYIFYGTRPELYSGTSRGFNEQPVDAGNSTSFVIDGLDNGTLYYFSVVAYDFSDPPHMSVFSKEVSARPSNYQDGK